MRFRTLNRTRMLIEYGISDWMFTTNPYFFIDKTIQKWVIIFIKCFPYVLKKSRFHTIPEIKTVYF